MRAVFRILATAGRDRRGAGAIEYAVIAAMLSIAIVATVTSIGSEVAAMFAGLGGAF
ncbi:MAG: Flp family type IVb pilin [Alphaproteobacteria bacterium]|nr:MAG: Flp family type IVb pilin [Alphaproteobacteria bacterium]